MNKYIHCEGSTVCFDSVERQPSYTEGAFLTWTMKHVEG